MTKKDESFLAIKVDFFYSRNKGVRNSMRKKELIYRYPKISKQICTVYNWINGYRIQTTERSNTVTTSVCFLKKVNIKIKRKNNAVHIKENAILKNTQIIICGNNNYVEIEQCADLNATEIYCEDNENYVSIGENTKITGRTHLAAIEGTQLCIGSNCLFSRDIHIATGDSHSILNAEGQRINRSKDIKIGNHVWIGRNVSCLKGAVIEEDCVIGACSVVTKAFSTPHCCIAGNPGKIIQTNIDWDSKRIPL